MAVPGIVESRLGGEEVAAEVPLGGEDRLFITPTRTLIYRAEGLLSDQSVDAYPHDAERVTVASGRRKARITLDYSIDGEREFTVPSDRLDDVLHPVLAGVLNAAGVTAPGETVNRTYRFSELTLVITSERLVKHVGEAVWDEEYEEHHYEDVTGLAFEEGSVATQVVLDVDGRQQRVKAPNDSAPDIEDRLTRALLSYHDADSLAALSPEADPDADEEPADDDPVTFGEGVDPLSAARTDADDGAGAADEPPGTGSAAGAGTERTAPGGTDRSTGSSEPAGAASDADRQGGGADATATGAGEAGADATSRDPGGEGDRGGDSFQGSEFEPASEAEEPGDADDVAAALAELRTAVERQNELLAEQQRTIDRLVEELSRGR